MLFRCVKIVGDKSCNDGFIMVDVIITAFTVIKAKNYLVFGTYCLNQRFRNGPKEAKYRCTNSVTSLGSSSWQARTESNSLDASFGGSPVTMTSNL